MIKSFKSIETAKIWSGEVSRKLPFDIQSVARRKLRMIAAASSIETLKVPPGNQLEALKGDKKGQHSVRINKQWRICFNWHETDAYEVEIVDYH